MPDNPGFISPFFVTTLNPKQTRFCHTINALKQDIAEYRQLPAPTCENLYYLLKQFRTVCDQLKDAYYTDVSTTSLYDYLTQLLAERQDTIFPLYLTYIRQDLNSFRCNVAGLAHKGSYETTIFLINALREIIQQHENILYDDKPSHPTPRSTSQHP